MQEASATLATLPGVRISLLGAPRLARADGTAHVLERKDAALIAMLALDGPAPRAKVAACLWPATSESQARTNLRQRLFRLRQLAGRDVLVDDGALRLADDVALDIVEAILALEHDADAAAGELLGGHDYGEHEELERWVAAARERWRATRTERLARRAGELEAKQQIAQALSYAQRLVGEEPLLEHGHRRLMRLHYLRGDRAAATATFTQCRKSLRDELGIEPDAETMQLARLIEAGAALTQPRAPARPPGVLRPPRLVGREEPWRCLQASADAAGVVLISGEAGIGKSRLLGDFAATASRAVACSARPGDASLPFALLARVVRALVQAFGPTSTDWARGELARIVPELGAAPAGELAVLRLQQAMVLALSQARAAGLTLVVVDDLHFADASSLELLPALIAAGRELRLAWLLATRAGEMPPALRGWLDAHASADVERLLLGALDAPAVHAVLESLAIPGFDAAAWAPALRRHTGGNPMFLLETLIALLDRDPAALCAPPRDLPAPAQVGALIERRLHQLGPAALRLARLAALAGQDFSVELAAAVLRQHPLDIADAWRELDAAQLIRDSAFAHDLILEAAQRAVPQPIARELHGEVAQWLERHDGPPARVAAHWHAAQRWPQAGASFLAASAVAHRASQRQLEAELAARAAECFTEAGDQTGEFAARERVFHALRYVDGFDAQTASVAALAGLAQTPAQQAAALEARAMLASDHQQDEAALAAAREAGEIARALGDAARSLSVVRLEARALSRMNRAAEALELLHRHVEAARARPDDPVGARVLSDLGATLIICDRHEEALPLLDDALATATLLEDWGLAQEVLQHQGWALSNLGELVACTATYENARSMRTRFGAEQEAFGAHDVGLARHYKELGRFREALELLDAVRSWLSKSLRSGIGTVADVELANCWLWLGQTARAATALPPAAAGAAATVRAGHLLAQARIALQQQRPAALLLREALQLAETEGRAYYRLVLQGELSRALPPDEAAALALSALAESRALRLPVTTEPLTARAADALRRAGRAAEAAALARQVVDNLARRAPVAIYPAEYAWIAHQCLALAGDQTAADAALRWAVHWVRHVALPNVPDEFRDAFLHRNPVNRDVLAAASRL